MMKRIFYLLSLTVAMLGASASKGIAQDSGFWMKYALDKEAIQKLIKEHTEDAATARNYIYNLYLYCPEDNAFMNVDGDYGSQAVGSTRGFGLALEKGIEGNETFYYIRTGMMRETESGTLANYLGTDVYTENLFFDRDKGRTGSSTDGDVRWMIDHGTNNTDNKFTLKLSQGEWIWEKTYYLHYEAQTREFTLSEKQADASEFAFLNSESYRRAIDELAIQKELNVTGLVLNSRFGRNVKNTMWQFYDMDFKPAQDAAGHSIGMDLQFGSIADSGDGYAANYGKYGAAEIDVNTNGFYRQQITGLKNGLYRVKARCVYYPTNGENSSAFLFAKNNGALVTPLDDTAKADFDSYVNAHKNIVGNLAYYEKAFRWNVPAAEYMEKNAQACEVEVYATVNDGTLGFGIAKRDYAGYVFMDEVELYYYGDYEFGMDAYNTDESKLDERAYSVPRRYNLRRNFNLGKWNSLILPVDLTSGVIMGTFGEDVKVTRLVGINPANTAQILFEPVDLAKGEGIKAGECYLVWLTKEPDVVQTETYKFNIIGDADSGDLLRDVEVEGPVYHIDGVTRDGVFAQREFTGQHGSGDLQLNYKGYFYHNPTGAPAGSYIMSGGKVYHLSSAHYLSGSYWYLETPKSSSAQSKTFVIGGDDQLTDISGIVTEEMEGVQDYVYNLNGQKVADGTSLEGLSKGIYIVNGKKYVVK